MILINLIYYQEKVYILMNIWIVLMKRFNETESRSKDKFYSTLNPEDISDLIMPMQLMYGTFLILVI